MIHRRLPAIEVLCKLCVLESVVLECHPIIVSLLLSPICRLALFYFLCPVVRFFNDLKLHGRLGSTDAIQFYLTEEESDFLIGMVVQPFDSRLVFLTSVFHDPYNHIRRFTRRIGYQLAEVVVVGILQLILYDDFPIRPRLRRKDIDIEISHGRLCLINGNIKPHCICKESDVIVL